MKTLRARFDNMKRDLNFKVLIAFIVLLIAASAHASTYHDVTNFLNDNPAPSGCVNWVEEAGSGYKVWRRCGASGVGHRYKNYFVSTESGFRTWYDPSIHPPLCNGTPDFNYGNPTGATLYGYDYKQRDTVSCDGAYEEGFLTPNTIPLFGLVVKCRVADTILIADCRSYDTLLAEFTIDQCLNKLTNTYESCFQNCKDPVDKAGQTIAEICSDGIDNNCDGQIDEGCCVDNDGDGYNGYDAQSCTQGNDCNDNDPNINPATIWYKDIDNDKYSDGATLQRCEQPSDYKLPSALTATSGDCDDNDAAKTPQTIWYKDSDGDGYTDNTILTQCERPAGYKLQSELTSSEYDCNDNNPLVTLPSIWYKDTDNDGYSDGTIMTSCTRPGGFKPASELQSTSGDNKDDDGSIYPGAPEICDGKDNNQNGQTDEGCCNIASVQVSTSDVWPDLRGQYPNINKNNEASLLITLNNPAPFEGCRVEFNITPLKDSGGHRGDGHTGTRPKGTITPSPLSIPSGSTEASATYTSSVVSGQEGMDIKINGTNALQANINIKVPGMMQLGGGYYNLKCSIEPCSDYQHIDFYNVQSWVKSLFDNIAYSYRQRFPTSQLLVVTDASLLWGGLYDYKNTWAPPHTYHRIGTDIDVRSTNISVRNRAEFERFVCRNSGFPDLEYEGQNNEHYHLYFYPYTREVVTFCKEVSL